MTRKLPLPLLMLATFVAACTNADDADASEVETPTTGTSTGAGSTADASATDQGSTGSGSTGEPDAPYDGLWQTEGYGWIYALESGGVRVFETTTDSCVQVVGGSVISLPEGDDSGRLELEVPGLFKLGMAMTGGPDEALHFLADGLVVSPPAHRLTELPERCIEGPLGDDLSAFDTMTAWFDENYALFADRDVDWDGLVASHRTRLEGPDPEAFFAVAVDLLGPLQDAHVSLVGPDGGFEGRREEIEPVTPAMIEQAQELISTQYLTSTRQSWVGGQIEFAWLEGDIGYLATHGFGPLVSEDGTLDYLGGLAALEDALDEVFSDDAMRGLVLDLRTNGGGTDLYGTAIARRLTRDAYSPYSIRARTDPDDPAVFSPGIAVRIEPSERPSFEGPVAVLVGRGTVSAGEVAALSVYGRPGVTVYGEPTQGAFSAVLNHFLSNGWLLGLPNEHYVTEAGERFDVVGLPPDVATPVFSAEDLAASRDSALDAALAAF